MALDYQTQPFGTPGAFIPTGIAPQPTVATPDARSATAVSPLGNTLYAQKLGKTRFGEALNAGLFTGFGTQGPAGSAALTPEGLTYSSPYDPLTQQFAGAASGALAQAPPDLAAFLANFGATPSSQQATGLGLQFGNELQGYNQDAFAKQQLDRLNAIALPAEQQAANDLADRLFSRGRLGAQDTTSGRAFGELAQAQDAAQVNRAISAFGMAGEEADRLARMTETFGNLGSTLQGSNIGNVGSSLGVPAVLQSLNLQNALTGAQGLGASLDPTRLNLEALFRGTEITQGSKQNFSDALIARLNANKISGQGPSAAGQAVGSALGSAIGTYVSGGNPAGGKAGGKIGGAIGGG